MLKKPVGLLIASIVILAVIFSAKLKQDANFSSLSPDASAFAYCGWRITLGEVLYRDCWDNKPPAVYYLNAVVIALGGATPFNLWLGQSLWLAATALLFLAIQERIWGGWAAAISTALILLTLLHPKFYEGGGYTETYALLPITLTLGALWGYLHSIRGRYAAAIGLASALAFLFKPTYISTGLAAGMVIIVLHLRQRSWGRLGRALAWMAAGFALPLGLAAGYWAWQGSQEDLVFAVFRHNQQYIQAGFSLQAAKETLLIFLYELPLATLVMLGTISVAVCLLENRGPLRRQGAPASGSDLNRAWLTAGLGLAALFDIAFTTISGRNFRHYFQVPILTLAAASGYLFWRLSQSRADLRKPGSYAVLAFTAVALLALPWLIEVLRFEIPRPKNLAAFRANPDVTRYQPNAVEQFILENTRPQESILVWDYDPSIYFLTNRRSPTRYIFLRHLFTPTPSGPDGFGELLQELEGDPPALIIIAKGSTDLPYLSTEAPVACDGCPAGIQEGLSAFQGYLDQHYRPARDIQSWAVYTRIE